ncbi:MAG: YceI family protein, partial [Elusimicrobia bacterium]|nr:YceI family protein [Elusimicrobiota bacterium]
ATVDVAFAWKSSAAALGSPAALTLKVPVAGLKSKHSGLDKNLRKALSADKNPDIVFELASYAVETATGGRRELLGTGSLTVAGVTKQRVIRAALREDAETLSLDGEHELLMTDFGVKPPTALLGTVKAADKIVVKFHLDLRPSENTRSAQPQGELPSARRKS